MVAQVLSCPRQFLEDIVPTVYERQNNWIYTTAVFGGQFNVLDSVLSGEDLHARYEVVVVSRSGYENVVFGIWLIVSGFHAVLTTWSRKLIVNSDPLSSVTNSPDTASGTPVGLMYTDAPCTGKKLLLVI